MRIAVTTLTVAALVGLAACSPPEETTAPETAATAPEGAVPAEPSVGAPPEAGGGVPGSSQQSNDMANPDGTNADGPLPRETPATPDA